MNKHILSFCTSYIDSENNPEFAILIKGPWGCGKTWFVEDMQAKLIEKEIIVEKDILYISLFGISTIEEFESRLFEMLHPILSSPKFKLAGSVIKQAIKLGLNIDLNNDSDSNNSDNKNLKIEDLNKKILIIDDMERCDISPTKLLGYISGFIIDQGIRVILIGNEKEYKKKFESEIQKYDMIREKIIGYTFEITPDYDNAINSFINNYAWSKPIDNISEIIKNLLSVLEIKNLRIVRQAFQGVSYLIKEIPEYIYNIDYIKKIVEIYLLLFMQYSTGDLKRDETRDAIVAFYKYNKNINNYKKFIEQPENKNNYWLSIYADHIPLDQLWKDIIFDGKYIKEAIKQSIDNDFEKLNPESQSNLFFLLSNWRYMKPAEFKKKIFELRKEFDKGLYLHPGEILHITNILLLFSKLEIVPWSIEEIIHLINKTITKLEKKIIIIPYFHHLTDSYGGWGFDNTIHELVDIKKRLIELNSLNNKDKLIKDLNISINRLDVNFNEFIKDIIIEYGTEKYNNAPIFSWINIRMLFSKLKQLKEESQLSFLYALENRYQKIYSNGKYPESYHDDFSNICMLRDLYRKELNRQNKFFNPKFVHYNNIVKQYDELISYMKNSIETT